MRNVLRVALDRSIAYNSGILGLDGGIKGRVPVLTFNLTIEILFHKVTLALSGHTKHNNAITQ